MDEELKTPTIEKTKKSSESKEEKTEKKTIEGDTKIGIEGVKEEIEKDGVKTETTDLLNQIKEDQLKDAPGRKEAIESGDPAAMMKAFLNILSTLMSTYLGGATIDSTGYKKLQKILGKDIKKTMKKLSTAKPEEIEVEIQKYKKARKGKGTNKQIAYTYFISALQEHKLSEMEETPKKPADRIFDHLKDTVKCGDLLVLNKHTTSKKAEFGSAMLRMHDGSTTADYTHVVMVTKTNPIMFSHSTMSKENSSGSGAEGEVSLKKYASKFKNLDMMHLKTDPTIKEGLLSKVAESVKKKAGYDSGAPIEQFLGKHKETVQDRSSGEKAGMLKKKISENITDDAEKYNCVELITDNLPDGTKTKIENASHPNDLLKMTDLFQMEYMTTYPNGIQIKTEEKK